MEAYKKIYIGVGVFFVAVLLVAGFFLYQLRMSSESIVEETVPETPPTPIQTAYTKIGTQLDFTKGDSDLLDSLKAFRDIAADESNSKEERVQALNGINYAYTQSDFDATAIRDVVFSTPPFSTYYVASHASSSDPLHPEGGADVESVEQALLKLNELSNTLIPNHYAITRMEVASTFAYQRAASKSSAAENKRLRTEAADKIKVLAAAYDALPGLESSKTYSLPMRIQIMFAHASALAFVGLTYNDKAYLDAGEAVFQEVIKLGEAYPPTSVDFERVQNETLYARIFYASYYWNIYRPTNPDKIKVMLRPLIDVQKVKDTTVYKEYLPSHKDATVAPFATLRLISKQMPNLQKFLEGRGWKF